MSHPPPEDEGAAATMCDELIATPILHPTAPLSRRRQRKLGVKLSPGRRERLGGGDLRFSFLFLITLVCFAS